MDTIYINGIGFLTTIGEPLQFRTCNFIERGTNDEYYKIIDKVLRIYNKGGFRIKEIHCDGEYKSMMDRVNDELDITMNYANAQDHNPRAERNNRTIKESFRTALHRTGYSTIPKVMIQDLAEVCAERLNLFPAKHGVSQYYSPQTIVTGIQLDYEKHCKYEFGEYVQAHTQNNPINDMVERSIDGIYLRPNNNQQGGHVIMNLHTNKRITRGKITPVPLTDTIKAHVEDMAKNAIFVLNNANLPTFRKNALNRAKEFDSKQIVPSYLAYYQEILDKSHSFSK